MNLCQLTSESLEFLSFLPKNFIGKVLKKELRKRELDKAGQDEK